MQNKSSYPDASGDHCRGTAYREARGAKKAPLVRSIGADAVQTPLAPERLPVLEVRFDGIADDLACPLAVRVDGRAGVDQAGIDLNGMPYLLHPVVVAKVFAGFLPRSLVASYPPALNAALV